MHTHVNENTIMRRIETTLQRAEMMIIALDGYTIKMEMKGEEDKKEHMCRIRTLEHRTVPGDENPSNDAVPLFLFIFSFHIGIFSFPILFHVFQMPNNPFIFNEFNNNDDDDVEKKMKKKE